MVLSLSSLVTRCGRRDLLSCLSIIVCLVFVIPVNAQSGGGTDLLGTGGRHSIQGRIYFPSGRRSDVRLKVKLENTNAGDLTLMTDSNGSFTFRGLTSGSYTVVVDGGAEYETARESVYIDSDGSNTRRGITLPPISRLYTVDVSLRLKRSVASKPGVLNAALADVPASARELYEGALQSANSGDHKKAAEQLNQALAQYANFPLALNALGEQYLKLNQPEKAAEAFSAALKLLPEDFTSRLNYGEALMQSNRLAEAETHLRRALTKKEDSWPGHMYLGITLMRLRRYDESEVELRRALTLGGDDLALPHFYLGGIYWGRQEYKRAADELEKYTKLAPNVPDVERTRAAIKELRRKQ